MPDKLEPTQKQTSFESNPNEPIKEVMLNEVTPSELNYLTFFVYEICAIKLDRAGYKAHKEEIRKQLKNKPIIKTELNLIISTINTSIENLGDNELNESKRGRMYDKQRYQEILCKLHGLMGYEQVSVIQLAKEMNILTSQVKQFYNYAFQKLQKDETIINLACDHTYHI